VEYSRLKNSSACCLFIYCLLIIIFSSCLIQGGVEEGVAYFRTIEEFISLLERNVDAHSWKYMEDEMFLLQRPELREHIGENVSTCR